MLMIMIMVMMLMMIATAQPASQSSSQQPPPARATKAAQTYIHMLELFLHTCREITVHDQRLASLQSEIY